MVSLITNQIQERVDARLAARHPLLIKGVLEVLDRRAYYEAQGFRMRLAHDTINAPKRSNPDCAGYCSYRAYTPAYIAAKRARERGLTNRPSEAGVDNLRRLRYEQPCKQCNTCRARIKPWPNRSNPEPGRSNPIRFPLLDEKVACTS